MKHKFITIVLWKKKKKQTKHSSSLSFLSDPSIKGSYSRWREKWQVPSRWFFLSPLDNVKMKIDVQYNKKAAGSIEMDIKRHHFQLMRCTVC